MEDCGRTWAVRLLVFATVAATTLLAGASDDVELRDLTGESRAAIIEHTKHSFRMADGRICDATEYYRFKEAVNSSHEFAVYGHKVHGKGLAVKVKTSEQWEVIPSDVAEAWGFMRPTAERWEKSDREVPKTAAQSRKVSDAQGPWSPVFHDGPKARRIVTCESQSEHHEVIFVDERSPDRVTQGIRFGHYSLVKNRYKDSIVEVELWPLGQSNIGKRGGPRLSRICVKLPPDEKASGDFLPGIYVLTPAPDIEHPLTGKKPERPKDGAYDPQTCVLRYSRLDTAKVSPQEYLRAVESGRLHVSDWTWKRGPAGIAWVEKPVEVEVQERRAEGARKADRHP